MLCSLFPINWNGMCLACGQYETTIFNIYSNTSLFSRPISNTGKFDVEYLVFLQNICPTLDRRLSTPTLFSPGIPTKASNHLWGTLSSFIWLAFKNLIKLDSKKNTTLDVHGIGLDMSDHSYHWKWSVSTAFWHVLWCEECFLCGHLLWSDVNFNLYP